MSTPSGRKVTTKTKAINTNSGHYHCDQRPRASHALRSDQKAFLCFTLELRRGTFGPQFWAVSRVMGIDSALVRVLSFIISCVENCVVSIHTIVTIIRYCTHLISTSLWQFSWTNLFLKESKAALVSLSPCSTCFSMVTPMMMKPCMARVSSGGHSDTPDQLVIGKSLLSQ